MESKIDSWSWMCAPLNCSNIMRASHKGYNKYFIDDIGLFHGYHDSSLYYVVYFIKVMNEFNVVHEDVLMHTFSM
jgi:hypothetical protein